MAPTTKRKFEENEKVLCYHGPLLYEAKCVKFKLDTGKKPSGGSSSVASSPGSGEPKSDYVYFVHYQGWNKNWDEWVPENRILKNTPENLEKMSKLQQQVSAAASSTSKKKSKGSKKDSGSVQASGGGLGTATPTSVEGRLEGSRTSGSANTSRASTPVSEKSLKVNKRSLADDEQSNSSKEDDPTPSTSQAGATRRNKKAKPDEDDESNDSVNVTRFNVSMPEELKYVLANDLDLVANKNKVFNLPAKLNASAILLDFMKYVEKTQKVKYILAVEVTKGVKELFNRYVYRDLLYESERSQFEETFADNPKDPVDVYGSAHLLRLMVKINGYLNASHFINSSDVIMIESILNYFLEFLEGQTSKYFTSKNYTEHPEQNVRSAE